MLQDDDEDFVVHKAGPSLPIRRPRPLKSLPLENLPYPFAQSSSHKPYNKDDNDDTFENHFRHRDRPLCPHFHITPQPKIVIPFDFNPHRPTATSTTISKIPTPILSNTSTTTSSTVETQTTILPTPTLSKESSFEVLKSRSQSPTPSTSTRTSSRLQNKSRPPTPPVNVESKVKLYIEKVKKFDEKNRSVRRNQGGGKTLTSSLEDLYQVTTPSEVKNDAEQMEIRLRETLRIIKEKDEMINKLRESCHELKLKCADAENRIDEMRFGVMDFDTVRRSSVAASFGQGDFNFKLKQSQSAINLSHIAPIENNKKMTDKATETDNKNLLSKVEKSAKEKRKVKMAEEVESQLTTTTCTTDAADLEEDLEDLDMESRESNFDPVLEEKCSDWLEKVHNWKTDPSHKLSVDTAKDKDSTGDRDSGFRGSAELEPGTTSTRKSQPTNHHKSHQKSKSRSSKNLNKIDPEGLPESTKTETTSRGTVRETLSKSPTPPTDEERFIFSRRRASFQAQINQQEMIPVEESSSLTITEESGPPSLQVAQPWFTFSSHLNPCSATDYEGFPSHTSSNHSRRYSDLGARSMDNLHFSTSRHNYFNSQSGASVDHKELLRNFDKRFKTLQPLLDNATAIALRVKRKSENLAKIVHDANISQESQRFRKNRQSFS